MELHQPGFWSDYNVQSTVTIYIWCLLGERNFVLSCCCSVVKSMSFTISWSLCKFMSIEPVMLSNHLILCCPLLLLPSIFPSIRVFFPVSRLFVSGRKSTGATVSVLPMNIQGWFPLGNLVWSPCSPRDSQGSSPASQFESINSLAFSLVYGSALHIHTWLLEKP